MTEVQDLTFQGLRLRSELPLSGASTWEGEHRTPDLHLRVAPVPHALDRTRFRNRFLQVGDDGAVLIQLPGTGRFLVGPDGREVKAEPAPGVDPGELRGALSGSVLGVVSYRMGRVPLHGSSVLLNGGTVALAGPPGAGKSTLAGAFQQAGIRVLGDDLLPVDTDSSAEPRGGGLRAHPGPGGLRLLPDAVETLALEGDERLRPVRGGKWGVPLLRPPSEPGTLRSVYLLDRRTSGPVSIQPLQGPEAVAALTRALYRRRVAWVLLGEAELLARLASMVERVAVQRLRYPSGVEGLTEAVMAVREREGGRPEWPDGAGEGTRAGTGDGASAP